MQSREGKNPFLQRYEDKCAQKLKMKYSSKVLLKSRPSVVVVHKGNQNEVLELCRLCQM